MKLIPLLLVFCLSLIDSKATYRSYTSSKSSYSYKPSTYKSTYTYSYSSYKPTTYTYTYVYTPTYTTYVYSPTYYYAPAYHGTVTAAGFGGFISTLCCIACIGLAVFCCIL